MNIFSIIIEFIKNQKDNTISIHKKYILTNNKLPIKFPLIKDKFAFNKGQRLIFKSDIGVIKLLEIEKKSNTLEKNK